MRALVLVGPKGSGKTTLGRWLEELTGGHFLEVEAIARRVLAERGGEIDAGYSAACFRAIDGAIDGLTEVDPLILETTGAAPETEGFVARLRERRDVRLIRVRASAETCAERIAKRDSSRQVAVPEQLVREMHARTEALDWPWDALLDNDPPLERNELSERLPALLG